MDKEVKVVRMSTLSYDDCTLGRLTTEGFSCFTLELPWVDNKSNISCIPDGSYRCKVGYSKKNGPVINIYDVVGRTHVQVHAGNYTSDILGCILVGSGIADINTDGVPDVTKSVNTLNKLLNVVGTDVFYLLIDRQYSNTKSL